MIRNCNSNAIMNMGMGNTVPVRLNKSSELMHAIIHFFILHLRNSAPFIIVWNTVATTMNMNDVCSNNITPSITGDYTTI